MKLTLTLQHGSVQSEHRLELQVAQPAGPKGGTLSFTIDGQSGEADCACIAPGLYSILIEGRSYEVRVSRPPPSRRGISGPRIVTVGTRHYNVDVHDPRERRAEAAALGHGGPLEVVAPMPGRIVKVLVETTQDVAQGAGLLVIEAMKMQNELRAPRAGRVEAVFVAEGTGVEAGARLVKLV